MIKKIQVSFLGGHNNVINKPNTGGIDLWIDKLDTNKKAISIVKQLDCYSPIKKPVIVSFTYKFDSVFISDQKGNTFELGQSNNANENCGYNCDFNFDKKDQITFKSSLGLFPYCHGFSIWGLGFFMRYHYYTLKIKKQTGQVLLLEWKYSIYKYVRFGKKRREWSSDYCVDNGGGLTKLKIKN